MCKVSVIIPVFNSEKYLCECINSVLNQSLKDIEIICVDDGSSDNSVKILQQYSNKDDRVYIIQKDHIDGTGAGGARNLGMEYAHGEYLLFLDSDDFFERTMIEEAYSCATINNSELVIFNAYTFDMLTKTEKLASGAINKGILGNCEFITKDNGDFKFLFQTTWGGVWNILFSRSFIENKCIRFQEMRYTDDMFFAYISLAEANKISILDKPFVHYRINIPNTQTSSRYQYMEIMYNAPVKIKEELEKRGLFEKYKVSFWNRMIPHIVDYLCNQTIYEKWRECYSFIKNELAEKLNLYEFIEAKDSDVICVEARDLLEDILNLEYDLFLFKNKDRADLISYQIPSILYNKDVRLVIYGAGMYGKSCFFKIYNEDICKVVSWVDKRYEELGYPICSPCDLHNIKFDYVLICIRNHNILKEIQSELKEIGVSEERILSLQF